MIDKSSPIPLYHQVMQDIKGNIKSKKYVIGDTIPSEAELIANYGVSRMTIRLAIQELEKEGFVTKVQGKGTFVKSEKVTQELGTITSWSETMRAQGKEPIAKKIKKYELEASQELADLMEIEVGTKLFYIERVRYVDGEAISISKVHIVAEYTPGLLESEGIEDSLYKILEEKYKIELSTASEIVEAFAADAEQAKILSIKQGTPVINVSRLTYDPFGKTIEYAQNSTRGDKYAYKVMLRGRKNKS